MLYNKDTRELVTKEKVEKYVNRTINRYEFKFRDTKYEFIRVYLDNRRYIPLTIDIDFKNEKEFYKVFG